jgi:glycosyltransferase involved in cell wall biosynthesis
MTKTPKLCLNMIVKNESKIITRLLDSICPLIDTYCICDTGSTDNTCEIIESYFKTKNIPGKLICEPFQNFEYNRSFALKACDEIEADYVLLMDADMILSLNESPETIKDQLTTHDCFFMFQGSESMYYKNTRIVRNKAGFSYKGVTHEYVDLPPNATQGTLSKDAIFIRDIGDGGAKADKFERDVRLLKQGLKDDPTNVRYMFYLANSLKDLAGTQAQQMDFQLHQIQNQCETLRKQLSGEPTCLGILKNMEVSQTSLKKEKNTLFEKHLREAINWYIRRIEAGGFWEEVWYSHYNIGHAYFHLKDFERGIYYFHKAYILYPQRVENIYHIVKYYREQGQNAMAAYYYLLGKKSLFQYQSRDYLFIERDIYDYKLDYEMTIVGYYENPEKLNMPKLCMNVLCQSRPMDETIYQNVLSNYKFYSQPLMSIQHNTSAIEQLCNTLTTIGTRIFIMPEFVSSTPSYVVCPHDENKIYGLVRYVNYSINDKGEYVQRDKIHTINVLSILKRDVTTGHWGVTQEKILNYDTSHDNYYVGIEDVRLFFHSDGHLYYSGNRGLVNNTMVVEHGQIDTETGATCMSQMLKIRNQNRIEKNWVMFSNNNDPEHVYMVYKWYPLTIGKIVNDTLNVTHEINTPYLFKNVRGSTNGVVVGDELWFLCHVVSYEERRHYYHMMIMLDKNTFVLKRHSAMFTFEREKVEYCLSMEVREDCVLFGYSTLDRNTKYMAVIKNFFN